MVNRSWWNAGVTHIVGHDRVLTPMGQIGYNIPTARAFYCHWFSNPRWPKVMVQSFLAGHPENRWVYNFSKVTGIVATNFRIFRCSLFHLLLQHWTLNTCTYIRITSHATLPSESLPFHLSPLLQTNSTSFCEYWPFVSANLSWMWSSAPCPVFIMYVRVTLPKCVFGANTHLETPVQHVWGTLFQIHLTSDDLQRSHYDFFRVLWASLPLVVKF